MSQSLERHTKASDLEFKEDLDEISYNICPVISANSTSVELEIRRVKRKVIHSDKNPYPYVILVNPHY